MRLKNEANFVLADYILDTSETIEALHNLSTIENTASMLYVPFEILQFKCRLLAYARMIDHVNCSSLDAKSDLMKYLDCTKETYPEAT